jgi:hypothetical protein
MGPQMKYRLRLMSIAVVLSFVVAQAGAEPASASSLTPEGRLITRSEAEVIFKRYRSVPGGFVLEDNAAGLGVIKTARYDAARNALIFDDQIVYALRIPASSIKALASALAQDDRVGVSLGEDREIVYGKLAKSSQVALDLKLADNFLGDFILPPQEWIVGYRFANGFAPVKDLGSSDAAVFFRFKGFEFAVDGQNLALTRAGFDALIIPIQTKKAPDGGYLPDFKAIERGVGFEPYLIGAQHVAENIGYYLEEQILDRVLAYGEAASLLRQLQVAGVDLRQLASSLIASADSGPTPRVAKTLQRGWSDYLSGIQAANQYANWTGPPYDLYVQRTVTFKPASGRGQ